MSALSDRFVKSKAAMQAAVAVAVSGAEATAESVSSAAKVAVARGSTLAEQASAKLRELDEKHATIADHADSVAKATRVAAGVAVVGAAVTAPTGLTAIGVTLGVVSAPVIATAAPVIVAVAGGAITISAAASLYSKAKKRGSQHPSVSDEIDACPTQSRRDP